MSTYKPYVPLTAEQRFRLGELVRGAAKLMPVAEGREMEMLFSRLLADGQHLRERVRKLDRKLTQARAAAEPPAPEDTPIPCVVVAGAR